MSEEAGRESVEQQRAKHTEHQPSHIDGMDGLLAPVGLTAPLSGTLLGDPRLNGRGNAPMKAAVMRQAQRTYGNRAVQRYLYGLAGTTVAVQRDPDGAQTSADTATEAASTTATASPDTGQWDTTVQDELEQFLERFSNIEVTVRWTEEGAERSETVAVHPPYFMNSERTERSAQRLTAALEHRESASPEMQRFISEVGRTTRHGGMGMGRALVGKSTPEEIQTILQQALDRGLVQAEGGRSHPNSTDLREWLVQYGIGIDCSGFVSQALNRLMERGHGRDLESSETIGTNAAGLSGGTRQFERVDRPDQLRVGDTMHIEGHIRIIMNVQTGTDGVVFTTAEAHAGSTDAGPDRATWRYSDPEHFRGLEKQDGDAWAASLESPTFGHYRRLEQFREGQESGEASGG